MSTDRDLNPQGGAHAERRLGRNLSPEAGRFAEPRSWMARTKDEIASWFGDTAAMRRRQWDEAAGDHSGKGPVNDTDADARIVQALNERLTIDPALDATGIKTSALDGVVTLDGTVATLASAQRAEALATAVGGVKRVVSNLVVA